MSAPTSPAEYALNIVNMINAIEGYLATLKGPDRIVHPDSPAGLLARASGTIIGLAERSGIIQPLRDTGETPVPVLSTVDQFAQSIGAVLDHFEALGATKEALAEALQYEADRLEDEQLIEDTAAP
jgi:hypothetical protein